MVQSIFSVLPEAPWDGNVCQIGAYRVLGPGVRCRMRQEGCVKGACGFDGVQRSLLFGPG